MNDKIDVRSIINRINFNLNIQRRNFLIDDLCINYFSLIKGDIDYLTNFLHAEKQSDTIIFSAAAPLS